MTIANIPYDLSPRAPALCKCGCGEPARGASRYASEACRKRYHISTRREYNRQLKAGLIVPKKPPEPKYVTVRWTDVAEPDRMPESQFKAFPLSVWRAAGAEVVRGE